MRIEEGVLMINVSNESLSILVTENDPSGKPWKVFRTVRKDVSEKYIHLLGRKVKGAIGTDLQVFEIWPEELIEGFEEHYDNNI